MIVVALIIGAAAFFLTAKPATESVSKKETTSQTATKQKTATIKHTGNVNLRKKSSSKSDIITSMAPGSKITVLEETKNWAKVKFEDKTGWCYKKYLKFDK